VNKKCLEALIKSGAFDFEKQPRRRLFEALDRVVEYGAGTQRDKASGQSSLFGLMSATTVNKNTDLKSLYGTTEEWPEKLRLSFEKESMGFYVSGHPLDQYSKELQRYAKTTAAVAGLRDGDKITVAGVVSVLRERPTKTGKRMAFITLEDLSGSVEVICFPGGGGGGPPEFGKPRAPRDGYDKWEAILKTDEPILITGKVQVKSLDDGAKVSELIAEEIKSLAEVREKRAKRLRIAVPAELIDDDKLARLREELARNPGLLPVTLELEVAGEATAEVAIGMKVKVSDSLIEFADRLFGQKCAEVS
jgi:DNA polymerase-3 subunit alpha